LWIAVDIRRGEAGAVKAIMPGIPDLSKKIQHLMLPMWISACETLHQPS
jgi:hypothetical protein